MYIYIYVYIYICATRPCVVNRTLGKLLFQFGHDAGMAKRVSGGGENF